MPSLREKHGELLLRELVRRWANYKDMICWLSHFFDHLDGFVWMNCIPPLKEVALTSFRDLVYEKVKSKVRDAVIMLINQEREGSRIDRPLLRNVLDVFVGIGEGKMKFYENDFEDAMLEDTDAYYSQKASKWIVECSCHDYMLKTWECVVREHKRVAHYLHHSSGRELFESVVYNLCRVYKNQLLDEFRVMLQHNEVKILKMMYLFSFFVWDSGQMENIFQQHVTSEGITLVQQAGDAAGYKVQEFVRNVMELNDKYLGHVIYCFSNEFTFRKAFKDAFEVFCNKPVVLELLAAYCDDILKKGGSEKLGDEALEETLLKVIMLLSYTSDKNLFAEFYRMKLTYRLLFERNVNYDHERLFLAKFKQEFGSQFTSKMEGMVTEMSLARKMQNQFQEYLSRNETSNSGIEMSVSVFTTGLWPSYKSSDLILSAELAKCVEVFDEFYKTKTKKRKLTWIYSLGTCHINVKFEQKTIELILGTCQASVLLLFNDADKFSYSDIKTRLNLADDDLIGLLHSLSCSKYKILNKDPETGPVSITDNFEFNFKFTVRMGRIRIPRPPLIDEREKMFQDLDKNRQCAIDAAIVRIMKYRKVLGHQKLVTECVHQLSHMFKPDVEVIAKRIQHLITLDCLERDDENPENFRCLVEDADR